MIPPFAPEFRGILCVASPSTPAWPRGMEQVDFCDLTAGLLARLQPAEVHGWLFCSEYDGMDLARIARTAGFAGVMVLRSVPLPRPGLVRRELAQVCPAMTVRLDPVTGAMGGNHVYERFIVAGGSGAQQAVRESA